MSWSHVAVSVAGPSHRHRHAPCEDASGSFLFGDGCVALVACDGAGSARKAGEGSRTARTAVKIVTRRRGRQLLDTPVVQVPGVTKFVHDALIKRAKFEERPLTEFHCTLVAAVVAEDHVIVCHIGDGAVVGRRYGAERYDVLSWPRNGAYAGSTYFITQPDWHRHLRWSVIGGRFDEVAVMTDGITPAALETVNHRPHDPFFQPLFRRLSRLGSARLRRDLLQFLEGPALNDRCDDDRTIVVALRRSSPAAPSSPGRLPKTDKVPAPRTGTAGRSRRHRSLLVEWGSVGHRVRAAGHVAAPS